MCIIFGKKKPVKRVAKRHIPIIKYCYMSVGGIHSWYRGKKYILNTEYEVYLEQVPKDTPYGDYFLEIGLHSYSRNVVHNIQYISLYNREVVFISYKTKPLDTLKNYTMGIIVKVYGYIPKGSEYFKNDRGEYISNRIVLTNYEEIVGTNKNQDT